MSSSLLSSDAPRVGIVVAAHAPLAEALVATAQKIFEVPAGLSLAHVEIEAGNPPAEAMEQIAGAVEKADVGAGVLVLADLFGGSAANVALAQLGGDRVEVLTGANLAMILEALSFSARGEALPEIARRAAEAARSSVVVAGELLAPAPLEARPAA